MSHRAARPSPVLTIIVPALAFAVMATDSPGAGERGEWVCPCGQPTLITSGHGNDTEPAWSPDGTRIAFQTDRNGDLDLAAVDVKAGTISILVGGRGHACYPAWTPSGDLIYSFGDHHQTAVAAAVAKSDGGYNLRMLEGEQVRALTRGYWRDYTPSVTPDGSWVYYASTRSNIENSASLWRLSLREPNEQECVLHLDSPSTGATQPSVSPDGRVMIWCQMDGFRGNWRLRAARPEDPGNSLALTGEKMSAYAPRWAPDGRTIAFTGFRSGDPAWQIYLLSPVANVTTRLDTGPGNSRNPAWSPDGKNLVFENKRSGFYKLFRVEVNPGRPTATATPAEPILKTECAARVEFSETGARWVCANGTIVPATIQGAVTFTGAGGATLTGKGHIALESPPGLDYGTECFYVRMKLVADAFGGGPRIAVVGQYPQHALGWQIFLNEAGRVCFNSRDPKGSYIGIMSDLPVQLGKPFDVAGVRDGEGGLRMYIDGVLQSSRAAGATMSYAGATAIALGRRGGGPPLTGSILAFETGRGYPPGIRPPLTMRELFPEEHR